MITIEQFKKMEHQKVNSFNRMSGVRVSHAAPIKMEEAPEEEPKQEEKKEADK